MFSHRTKRNEKGFLLLSSLFVTTLLTALSVVAYSRAMNEFSLVSREIDRVKAYYVAEAGIQNVVAQIGSNAYTGFILIDPVTGVGVLDGNHQGNISVSDFQNTYGASLLSSFSVDIDYIDAADYVILEAQGVSGSESRILEARVFLESNFSKYLLFVDYPNFGSGTNAIYGEPTNDPLHPEGVAPHQGIRPNLYFTGDYQISGNNVQVYGDTATETAVTQSTSTSKIHGDTYTGTFQTDVYGNPTDDGITGGVVVTDGYKDDLDYDKDGIGPNPGDPDDPDDFPDRHGLNPENFETLPGVNKNFYTNSAHNSIPTFGGATVQSRYLEFVPDPSGGNFTIVKEYNASNYTTQVASYNLPKTAVVYVNGDAYVKGAVEGRISVVSSKDIHFMGNVTYKNGAVKSDPNHSVAFLASDQLYFKPDSMTVSGIFYSENENNNNGSPNGVAFEASKTLTGGTDTTKTFLRVYGNRLVVGRTNLSIYADREYLYDAGLRKYRPPGLPVEPSIQIVREL
ncbi:MAG: hypothetical protein HY587_04950 [Candidatus Omnitrophica bacterium]|nr:hypothetical protein [Candidatus Omnitrophota bacterium]